MNFNKRQILVFSLAMMTFIAWAHEGKHHPKPNTQEKTSFVQINELYLTDVKPIFEKSVSTAMVHQAHQLGIEMFLARNSLSIATLKNQKIT